MSDTPTLSITLLGAGQEVGRSCCVLQYHGKTVVCDAGVHPAHSGMASLPFIDELDWSTVDALLITHRPVQPIFSPAQTNFRDGKGKVYMTHPTKALHKFMMQDFVRQGSSSSDALFSPMDMAMSLAFIIPVSVHQLISPCPGVSFTPYHAGHVLGACMFLIDIAGIKILYTGDYSREEDRHLVKAEVPPLRPDVLIVESTYGVQSLEGRPEKELRFTNLVHSIIRRGGHSMAVYQTYIHTMNSNIRTRFAKRDNPFVFKHISNLPQPRGWEKKIAEGPPCVVLASPGFMQTGPSRELFELWAPDSRNGLIITGYSIEGTLARDIMTEPEEFESLKGQMIPRKISVAYISFSAHVDYSQNSEFIELVKAQHVVLVHGEQTAMARLRAAMTSRYKERDEDVKIYTPRNLETLELSFRGERVAKAIGTLADKQPQVNDVVSGLLVSKDFSYTLLDPRDLKDFAGLSTCTVTQRQKIVLGVRWELVRWHLEGMYGNVEEGVDKNGISIMRVMGAIDVKQTQEHELTIEWDSSASNDMIADSTLALIAGIDKSPASVKLTSQQPHTHSHSHPHADRQDERIKRLAWFLEAHFGEVEFHMPDEPEEEPEQGEDDREPSLLVRLDEATAQINLVALTVNSTNEALRKRVEAVLDMAVTSISSLSESFVSKTAEPVEEVAEEVKSEEAVVVETARKDELGLERGTEDSDSDVDSLLEVHD
ncbi:beta-lactamase-like protein [Mycena rebaudengoi]|nr:beta-lactamase-like protein [Mycena rebaudengoi]